MSAENLFLLLIGLTAVSFLLLIGAIVADVIVRLQQKRFRHDIESYNSASELYRTRQKKPMLRIVK